MFLSSIICYLTNFGLRRYAKPWTLREHIQCYQRAREDITWYREDMKYTTVAPIDVTIGQRFPSSTAPAPPSAAGFERPNETSLKRRCSENPEAPA